MWCCKCTNYYTFSSSGGTCQQCVPPATSNAVNPSTTAGTGTYSWTCTLGYYGASVSRTCASTGTTGSGGSWSGSAISCAACSAPAAPSNGYSTRSASPDLDTWTLGCNAGYVSSTTPAIQTRRCSTTSGAFSGSSPTCNACGSGNWCSNGVRNLCPGGTFGLTTATTLSSSACSGTCSAGECRARSCRALESAGVRMGTPRAPPS